MRRLFVLAAMAAALAAALPAEAESSNARGNAGFAGGGPVDCREVMAASKRCRALAALAADAGVPWP